MNIDFMLRGQSTALDHVRWLARGNVVRHGNHTNQFSQHF